jgi:hypothetical protein
MSDLPFQALLQQAHARSVSGEELEAFGKKAAAQYSRGDGSLTEAVVETVKHAGLSPEQVKRVVEFANTTAYLTEFKKEGSHHRVVEFQGGPADPSAVLQDLNDGGGGTVFDVGQEPRTMHDRGYLDFVSLDAVDNPVVLEQQFTQVAPVVLRHDSARFREQGQHFRG